MQDPSLFRRFIETTFFMMLAGVGAWVVHNEIEHIRDKAHYEAKMDSLERRIDVLERKAN